MSNTELVGPIHSMNLPIEDASHFLGTSRYHRSLRSKTSYKSKLDAIEGVGEKRRNALLKAFGSVKAVAAATEEELSKVVPKDVAGKVHSHFRKSDDEK